jgi:hypothetical protein
LTDSCRKTWDSTAGTYLKCTTLDLGGAGTFVLSDFGALEIGDTLKVQFVMKSGSDGAHAAHFISGENADCAS